MLWILAVVLQCVLELVCDGAGHRIHQGGGDVVGLKDTRWSGRMGWRRLGGILQDGGHVVSCAQVVAVFAQLVEIVAPCVKSPKRTGSLRARRVGGLLVV